MVGSSSNTETVKKLPEADLSNHTSRLFFISEVSHKIMSQNQKPNPSVTIFPIFDQDASLLTSKWKC